MGKRPLDTSCLCGEYGLEGRPRRCTFRVPRRSTMSHHSRHRPAGPVPVASKINGSIELRESSTQLFPCAPPHAQTLRNVLRQDRIAPGP